MPKPVSVLLTGPTGTVGGATLKQLVENPDLRITLFQKPSAEAEKELRPYADRVTIVWGDLTDRKAVFKACHGHDVVLHVAALIPPLADEKPDLAHAINVGGTAHLIDGLKRHSPQAFLVYTSSVSVYGDRLDNPWIRVSDPLRPSDGDAYGRTKVAAESLVQQSGLDFAILRLTAIMGINNHQMSGLMFHMPLDTAVEICTPEDTGRALAHAVFAREALKGRVWNLGGGAACRIYYRDFLARSFDAFGMGPLDFPPKAFAEKNFHCGFLADGDALQAILHFRRDTIESYFQALRAATPTLQWLGTSVIRWPLKKILLAKSEPYQAWKTGDAALIARFFKDVPDKAEAA